VTQPNPLANIDPQQLAAILAAVQGQQAPAAAPNVAANVQPAQAPAPVQPTVDINLGDVLGRVGYGPELFKKDDPIGTSFTGTVATPTQVKQLTDYITKAPKFYDDGNPIPVLIVGLDVPATERHPEGRATWHAKGKDIGAINKAMVDAGVPVETIKQGLELGATLTVTFSHTQPVKSKGGAALNDAKIRTVTYTRPGSTPPAAPAVQAAPAPAVASAATAPAQPSALTQAVGNNPAGVDAAAILAALGAATPPAA
jgi:hypothetical protein